MEDQKRVFLSGNELASIAIKQIKYHVMGYYPITPSTQIAERVDEMVANGELDLCMIPAEGEHSAAGICYGAATAGGRVVNATSSQGLLYALEQLPVHAGTRFPGVLNVACRSISGPLSIKGDHSDIMFALNTGWIILFANIPQEVYDLNLCAIRISEICHLPVIVAFDGFFTSHQKKNAYILEDDVVSGFVGTYKPSISSIDVCHPVSIGSYMNEEDYMNNRYQLRLALDSSKSSITKVFEEFYGISKRMYSFIETCNLEQSRIVFIVLGSSYQTILEAIHHKKELNIGVICLHVLRPFPTEEIRRLLKDKEKIIVLERQDSFGGFSGNLGMEIRAVLQGYSNVKIYSRVYGLSGKEFDVEDVYTLYYESLNSSFIEFDYYGVTKGVDSFVPQAYYKPLKEEDTLLNLTRILCKDTKTIVEGGSIKETLQMPKRIAPGHSACSGCGIFVNLNLLLKGIEGNVVLLFQTGCAMIVTSCYPKTAFKVPYVHNLFQNGASTLSGIKHMFLERQKRGEIPQGDITFIMVTGDGGLDIGLGSALGAVLRDEGIIIFEYDNGGYMNTGYQLSYSTVQGSKTSTSHVGKMQYGKKFPKKNTPQIFKAAGCKYIATVSEGFEVDFIQKARMAQHYALLGHTAFIKAISVCPLNHGHQPNVGRHVAQNAVYSLLYPLYEVKDGKTRITYRPEDKKKRIELKDYFSMLGITKHLCKEEYKDIYKKIEQDIYQEWEKLEIMDETLML